MIATISLRRTLLVLFVAAIPSLVCILLIGSQANFLSFTPTWSDEIFYWHGILTFKVAGFQGGYYTINEAGAAAAFTHFYTYGPWFALIYGSIAKLTGWERITFILFNMLFVTLALVIFCRVAQLRGRQLFMLGLALSTFWCLITFLPTAMQEAFQQTLAILIATVIYRALTKRQQMAWPEYIGGILLLIVAALLRISWGIMFFPFLWLTARPTLLRRIAGALVAGLIVVAIYFWAQYTGSPGNNSVTAVLNKFSISFVDGWTAFRDYFGDNLNRYFNIKKNPLDVLQSVQVVALVLGSFTVIVVQAFHKRFSVEAAFHFYNLFTIIAAACALYIIATWGDYRVIGTHLMVSVLLLIAFKRYIPIQLFVIANVLLLPAFFGFFQPEVVSKYQFDVAAIDSFHHTFEAVAPYKPNPTNAWCNTVVFPVESFNPYLVGVPAGMGLSFFYNATVPGYRSKYVLLNQSSYDIVQAKKNAPDLEAILSTPMGTLYRNHSAKCPN